MGIYSDMLKQGNAGIHYFDADAINLFLTKDIELIKVADKTWEGEVVTITNTKTYTDILSEIVIHFNGLTKDITKNTLIIKTAYLALLTDVMQSAIKDYEQVPGGRREGVIKPVRENLIWH